MNAGKTKRVRRNSRKVLWQVDRFLPRELLAFCPACKALEIVRFTDRQMIPTRKFVQKRGKVYHSCGSGMPCRLHSSIVQDRLSVQRRDRLPVLSSYAARPGATAVPERPAARQVRLPAAV